MQGRYFPARSSSTRPLNLCFSGLRSPQILELSGIGKKGVLDQINIPVQLELPGVGFNVQDHMFNGLTFGKLTLLPIVQTVSDVAYVELKDGVSFDTLDVLLDPVLAAEQAKLQYVVVFDSELRL